MKKVTRNYKGIIQVYDYNGKVKSFDTWLNMRISKEMKDKLKSRAEENGMTLSNYIKQELEKVIKE